MNDQFSPRLPLSLFLDDLGRHLPCVTESDLIKEEEAFTNKSGSQAVHHHRPLVSLLVQVMIRRSNLFTQSVKPNIPVCGDNLHMELIYLRCRRSPDFPL
jgi:hypothetical protein